MSIPDRDNFIYQLLSANRRLLERVRELENITSVARITTIDVDDGSNVSYLSCLDNSLHKPSDIKPEIKEQITSSFRGEKKKKKKNSPEQVLRAQCSLRKEDMKELLVVDADVVSSLRILKDITYAHAKREGFTFGKQHYYYSISSYSKDHMYEIVKLAHRDYPNLFHRCETSGNTERPHSLKRVCSYDAV